MNLFLKPNSEKRFLIEAVNLDSGNFFSKYVFGSINGNVSFQFVQLEIAYTIELRPAQHFFGVSSFQQQTVLGRKSSS